ncbi:MAG: cbb3-type cytochrome c oxidase subunit I [Planctomycetota bacterium]|nr:cbb3-type cytochrome c oxidase subunit I [Planctomycetota bacterium]
MTPPSPRHPATRFFWAAGGSLLLAILAGAWAIQMLAWSSPGDSIEAFIQLRPIHVTFAVAWIFLAAIGGIWAYLPKALNVSLYSRRLTQMQGWLFFIAGVLALAGYLTGNFSGREYLNFTWPASLFIAAGWGCFFVNFFSTARKSTKPWPVYVWMWATGVVMFTWTFIEAHLWMLPWFEEAPVRDLSVQWKSYGGLTGSWNMLVYGLLICLLEQIGGEGASRSRKAFFFYWLGLTNLMFGYAHHTYHLPQAEWIRWMSFGISMTEWVVLLSLIQDWAQPWNREIWKKSPAHRVPRAFLAATSAWVGINLVLALLISIPTLNWFTHGTTITLAHAMGSTIGINSMVLFGGGFAWMLSRSTLSRGQEKYLWSGFAMTNLFLLGFFLILVLAGGMKGLGMVQSDWSFSEAQDHLAPMLYWAGWMAMGLFLGVLILLFSWFSILSRAKS